MVDATAAKTPRGSAPWRYSRGKSTEVRPAMPFKQSLANNIIQRYLKGYDTRMRMIQPRWAANVASTDPVKRRDGLILLHDAHEACHQGAFSSMRLKPTDWDAELSAVSLALTLGHAKVSLPDVGFAVLARDTAKMEELASQVLDTVATGFTDAPDQQFAWRKELTLPQRAFEWHHAQLYNVAGIIGRIRELSPRAESLTEHEGAADILARLGTEAGQMEAAYRHLRQWLDAHIDDQPR